MYVVTIPGHATVQCSDHRSACAVICQCARVGIHATFRTVAKK